MSSVVVAPEIHSLFRLIHAHDPSRARQTVAELAREGPLTVVSACLVGIACRYDGGHCWRPATGQRLAGLRLLPLCPEVLAGLGVPRPPAWFDDAGGGPAVLSGAGRIVDGGGRDLTPRFRAGADAALALARAAGATLAYLKEGSPMCGLRRVHVGTSLARAPGLWAALLSQHGLEIESDEAPLRLARVEGLL